MASPLANILHRSTLEALVGKKTFERGEAYFNEGRVEQLLRAKGVLTATVRGTTPYEVRIWASAEGLAYKCQCPFGAEGLFCKHAIAVALAWASTEVIEEEPTLEAALKSLTRPELYDILEAVGKDEAGEELIRKALRTLKR
ncbi:hypothetical protein BH09MYX1_BH09MYX1_44480 [soil metagenome]